MLREGLGVRDAADFATWWLARETTEGQTPPKSTKSAWDRHKNNGHFLVEPEKKVSIADLDRAVDLDQMVEEMLVAWYAANRDDQGRVKVPSDNDLRKWLEVVAKVSDLRERRKADEELRRMLAGAAFGHALPAGNVVDVTPAS